VAEVAVTEEAVLVVVFRPVAALCAEASVDVAAAAAIAAVAEEDAAVQGVVEEAREVAA
jgi:hypothetical protein